MTRRARRFLASISHVPPRQLGRRAWLILKRKWADAVLPRLPPPAHRTRPAPPLRADTPEVSLPPQTVLARDDSGRLRVSLLGCVVDLEPPVDWRPASLDHLRLLHLHYMDYLGNVDEPDLQRIVLDWIRANPRRGHHAWHAPWNSYAASIRVVEWMNQLAARRLSRDGWAGEVVDSIGEQVRFLTSNLETDIGGNHLIKNITALLRAGRFFAGEEAEAWTARGRDLLSREIDAQVLPDGLHFERSPAYHLQVLADLIECYRLLTEGGLRNRLGEALDRMAAAAVRVTHPDGLPSLFADGGLHMAHPPAEILRRHRDLGRAGPAEPDGSFALPEAGYFGFRRGEDLLLLDCGPIGPDRLPAHGHGDVGAFEWSVGGRRLFVDTGVFEYHAGPIREYCRGTVAHNTVTVGGRDQAEFYGSFRVGRRPEVRVLEWSPHDSGFVLRCTHDGYRRLPGSPRHERTFEASDRAVRVSDVVIGGAGQPVQARLLLHPDCEVEQVSGGLEIRCGGQVIELRTAAALTLERAPWFPDFGRSLPTTRVVLWYGAAPCSGSFELRESAKR